MGFFFHTGKKIFFCFGITCTDPESLVRGGPTLTMFYFFIVDERKEDPNTTKSGPSSLKWRFAGGPMMGQH